MDAAPRNDQPGRRIRSLKSLQCVLRELYWFITLRDGATEGRHE
jgi:hypothetical protein